MIYGDAFRQAPSFNTMLGPMRPNGGLNLEQAGRQFKGAGSKAAGMGQIGAGFLQGIMEARKKSQEAHEAGMSNFQMPSMPSMQRPQQMPLMQMGGQQQPMFGQQRMGGQQRPRMFGGRY